MKKRYIYNIIKFDTEDNRQFCYVLTLFSGTGIKALFMNGKKSAGEVEHGGLLEKLLLNCSQSSVQSFLWLK